jgi:hypothetical protein
VQTKQDKQLELEANLFGNYFLGTLPSSLVIDLYCKAMTTQAVSLNEEEEKQLEFIRNNPWSIGMVDGALAILKPKSLIRRKLITMLAILETCPEYCHLFFPTNKSIFFLFYLFYVGCRGIIKVFLGVIIVKFICR